MDKGWKFADIAMTNKECSGSAVLCNKLLFGAHGYSDSTVNEIAYI